MKKFLMILIMVGMALGLSGVTHALDNIQVDSDWYAGPDYLTVDGYDANPYIFSVVGGAWQNDMNYPNENEWSLMIYQERTGLLQSLGNHVTYFSGPLALAAHAGESVQFYLNGPTDKLRFYVEDLKPGFDMPNMGSVTVSVAVVPEPISSMLFLTGGVVLVGRKYMKKRCS